MENNAKNILVPWDFTETSIYSLEHAINVARVMDFKITLVHISPNSKAIKDLQSKLDQVASDYSKQFNFSIGASASQGKVFNKITKMASLPDTAFVIMKTDGIQGWQKYFGSNAIKMIRGSKTPFIVIQNPPTNQTFERIVYPIDFRSENKELVSFILYLTKFYKCKIYIFRMTTNDQIHKKTIANNIIFAKSLFEGKRFEFEIIKAEGVTDYTTEMLSFANSVNADLIVTQLQRNLTFTKFLLGVREQNIIANPYKIPVVCLNPKELTVYAGFH